MPAVTTAHDKLGAQSRTANTLNVMQNKDLKL